MSSNSNTSFVSALGELLNTVGTVLENKYNVENFLKDMGWPTTLSNSSMSALQASLNITESILRLRDLLVEIEKEDVDKNAIGSGIYNISKSLYDTIKGLATTNTTGQAYPFDRADFWNQMGEELPGYLLEKFLMNQVPKLYGVLYLLGILDVKEEKPLDINRWAYKKRTVHWDRLITALIDPPRLFKEVYKWNDGVSSLDYERFITALQILIKFTGLIAKPEVPSHDLKHLYYNHNNPHFNKVKILEIPIVFFATPNWEATAEIGLGIMPITPKADLNSDPTGFLITPLLRGNLSTIQNNSTNFISVTVDGSFKADGLFRFEVRPEEVDIIIDPTIVSLNGRIGIAAQPPSPWIMIGSAGGTRLEVNGFFTDFELKGTLTDPEFIFRIGTSATGGSDQPTISAIMDFSSSDGFIQKILGSEPQRIDLGGFIGWSSKHGVVFNGQVGFEIKFSPHIQLGPLAINDLYIGMKASAKDLLAYVGLGLSLNLGPLTCVVENIGAQLKLSAVDNGASAGTFGDLNTELGFKPPNGLGLSINAGAVIGGGYLFFDFEKEEYAGVLELTIAGFISAKAIGLITTKMPDGSKGFSMLIIITAEFMPAFQLGYGFTLIGVGGLLGLNRTVLLDPLRDAVRTGAVTSIMFPQNVVANAPRIISDLKTIFPPYEGKFLIGPMAKLGWGTPTLISLSLGLIIEIPGNIAILGVLKIALPEERIPLVQIQVLFVGTIDFDKKMLTFDASLYESFILTMTIEGDMAVRLKWGDNPDFLLSVGGFHPSYTPPPLALPTMRRLAINILNTSIAKIRVECYQAITSNTVQFGARADIMFDLSACSITGFISFDALFQFSPFYFIIEVAAGFKLRAAGIDVLTVRVRMSLEGPTPWRARGTGSVSILFFEISADFDVTWGEQKNTALPDIAILQTFIDEIKKKELWSTVLSTGKNLLVSLRKFNDVAEADVLVMHPAGSLVVQQKLLPLKVNFDKIGNQKTSDVQKIEITTATSSGELLTITTVDENFARAQYQNLSDAEKLSKPSFEKMQGGVSLTMGTSSIKNGKLVRKKVQYEITIIDKEPKRKPKGLLFGQLGVLFANFLKGNSVSKSVLSKNYEEKLQPFNEKMDVLQDGYTVAFQANNKAYTTGSTFTSEMLAQTFMQDQIAKNPSLKKEVHIILKSELQPS